MNAGKLRLSGLLMTGFLTMTMSFFPLHAEARSHHSHHHTSKHSSKSHSKSKHRSHSRYHSPIHRVKLKHAQAEERESTTPVAWDVRNQRGRPYRRGGANPSTGFDCSGLTQYTYRRAGGVSIPRTAAAQYGSSMHVARGSAQKGDLVFFRTRGRRIGHVGIYMGGGQFIHSPRPGKRVSTDSLASGYWAKHLVGFGRVPGCKPVIR